MENKRNNNHKDREEMLDPEKNNTNDIREELKYATILKLSLFIKNGDIANCRELILRNKNIETCEELYPMKNLNKIDFSQNKIKDLSMIEMNLNLQQIQFQNNLIESVEFMKNLTLLKDLNLSYNKIKVIDQLTHLTSLRTLILAYNEIENIPNLGNLSNLETLILKNNKIEIFTKPSKSMPKLKKISLSFNKIRQFCFGSHFINVQELRLNSNKMTQIEKDIVFMASLQRLYIQNNYIVKPDIFSYMNELKHMKQICMQDNPFFKKCTLSLLNQCIQNCKQISVINSISIPKNRNFPFFCFECSHNNISCEHAKDSSYQIEQHPMKPKEVPKSLV